MSEIKNKLQKIKEKASNPNVRLSEIEILFIELFEVSQPLMQSKEKKEERNLARETEKALFNAMLSYIDKLIKGEIEVSDDEMRFLYSQCMIYKNIETKLAIIEKSINESEQIDEDEKQEIIKSIKENIEKIKRHWAGLTKIFKKWQEKYQHKHSSPEEDENENTLPVPSTEEETKRQIDSLNQKITALQNQIAELKKSQDTNPEVQQQITTLQMQKEKFQAQLGELEEVSSSFSTPDTSPSNKKGKGFPVWGIILIVLGVLIAAGLAAYFILEKRNRPKLKKAK